MLSSPSTGEGLASASRVGACGPALDGTEALGIRTPSKHYRQEHVLVLHELICVVLDKAQQETIGGSKSEVKVVSKQRMQMWRGIKAG